jgi:hypothetical protein
MQVIGERGVNRIDGAGKWVLTTDLIRELTWPVNFGCHGESCVKGCRNQAGRKASCAYFGKLI